MALLETAIRDPLLSWVKPYLWTLFVQKKILEFGRKNQKRSKISFEFGKDQGIRACDITNLIMIR